MKTLNRCPRVLRLIASRKPCDWTVAERLLRRQLVSLTLREAHGPRHPNGMNGRVYEERLWSRMKEIDGLLECIEENWGCLHGESALACARKDGKPLLPDDRWPDR